MVRRNKSRCPNGTQRVLCPFFDFFLIDLLLGTSSVDETVSIVDSFLALLMRIKSPLQERLMQQADTVAFVLPLEECPVRSTTGSERRTHCAISGVQANNRQHILLRADETLQHALTGLTVIEYPTILVVDHAALGAFTLAPRVERVVEIVDESNDVRTASDAAVASTHLDNSAV